MAVDHTQYLTYQTVDLSLARVQRLTSIRVSVIHDNTCARQGPVMSSCSGEHSTCVYMQVDMDKLRQRCYPFWVAPEVLQGQAPSISSDVYALGMLIFEMLYRREPFNGEDPEVRHPWIIIVITILP